MSNYIALTYDPGSLKMREAMWIDDHFGRNHYGVQFDENGPIWRPEDVQTPPEFADLPTPPGAT